VTKLDAVRSQVIDSPIQVLYSHGNQRKEGHLWIQGSDGLSTEDHHVVAVSQVKSRR
jgi:hypothetical protein